MPWQPNTIEKILEELKENSLKAASDVFNFSVPVNQAFAMPGAVGQGQATGGFGATSGAIVHQPVSVALTDEDNTGTPTGTTNRIPIKGTFLLVKHTATPIDIVWIDFAIGDGQSIFLKPENGKTITLKPGGNIDITSDVIINDNEFVWLLFSEDSDVTGTGGFILKKSKPIIPIVFTEPANKSQADNVFGNSIGTIGVWDNESNILRMFIKQKNGNWASSNFTYNSLT